MRYYVEINPDLDNGFIVSFNTMAVIGSMQIVHHVIYCQSLRPEHLESISEWIQKHSFNK